MSRFILLGMLVSITVFASSATAQNEVVTGLLECRRIAEADKRLACFDALAGEYGSRTGSEAEQADAETDAVVPRDERVAGDSVAPESGETPPETQFPDRERAPEKAETAHASPETSAAARGHGETEPGRVASAGDLTLPYEGRIKAFANNARGDYRFRIGEGIVFERAGGPSVPSGDLTGAAITLSKNFLGQWRARVEGQPRELWVSPVRR